MSKKMEKGGLKNEPVQHFNDVQTIDVQPHHVEVETKPSEHSPQNEQAVYAHHAMYGEREGYSAPELHSYTARLPYSSFKARSFMMLFAFSLLAVTLSVSQVAQSKANKFAEQRLSFNHMSMTGEQKKLASTIDMLTLNTLAFEKSVTKLNKVVENKKALVQVETALHKQQGAERTVLTDKQVRNLLLRAGYQPSQLTTKQMEEFKQRYQGVDGDVAFARDVAGEIFQDEVESFVHKAKLISNVGQYVYGRIQGQ